VIGDYFYGDRVETTFKRKIKVDQRRAFNYIIQSTTADLTIDRAVELDKILESTTISRLLSLFTMKLCLTSMRMTDILYQS
jgi:DNA polymerase I-like protein with 3'-5' exonuclease and polymerase domains